MVSNSLLTSSSDVAGIPSTYASTKRKRKVVSIKKKLEICHRHEMEQSYTSLSKEYGLGKSTIHDMDQGVLYNLKRRYKRNLLEKMILYETINGLPYDQFAKNLNIKDCIYSVANAWEQIQCISLQKAWNKLLGAQASSIDESRSQEPICINLCPDSELEIERFMETFHDHGIMVTEGVTEEWLEGDDNDVGYQELSDDEIISEVLGHADIESEESSENDENTPAQHLVSSKDALEAFDICMRWMEQQEETTPQQVMLFQKLKNDAAKKRSTSLKQLSMDDFVL